MLFFLWKFLKSTLFFVKPYKLKPTQCSLRLDSHIDSNYTYSKPGIQGYQLWPMIWSNVYMVPQWSVYIIYIGFFHINFVLPGLLPGRGTTFGRGATVEFLLCFYEGWIRWNFFSQMLVRNEGPVHSYHLGLLLAVAWHFGVEAGPKIYLIDHASIQTEVLLRRFFPLRSHLQVLMSTVGVATRHRHWSLESVMVSKMMESNRCYSLTFWMVDFQTLKGRWGIPNIC